jgi:hypothetical protein
MITQLNKKLYFVIISFFYLTACSNQVNENKSIFETTLSTKKELLKNGFVEKMLTISNGKVDTIPSQFGLLKVIKDTMIECWLCNSGSTVSMEKISLPLKDIDTTTLNDFFIKKGFTKTNDSTNKSDYLLISTDGIIKYGVLLYKTHIGFIREFACPKGESGNVSTIDSVN